MWKVFFPLPSPGQIGWWVFIYVCSSIPKGIHTQQQCHWLSRDTWFPVVWFNWEMGGEAQRRMRPRPIYAVTQWGQGGPWGGSRRAKHAGLGNHSPSFMHVTNIHVSIPVLDSGHKVIKIAHAFKHAVSLRRQTVQQKVTTQRGKSSDKIPQRILWK